MTSREAMLAVGSVAYYVSIPLLLGGMIFGLETMTFAGAVLVLVGLAVIAAS